MRWKAEEESEEKGRRKEECGKTGKIDGQTRVREGNVGKCNRVAWWTAWKGKTKKGGKPKHPLGSLEPEESQVADHELRITDDSGWNRRLPSDFTGSSADAVYIEGGAMM